MRCWLGVRVKRAAPANAADKNHENQQRAYLQQARFEAQRIADATMHDRCRIPDDHISIRSWKLAAARDVLATLLTSLGVSKP